MIRKTVVREVLKILPDELDVVPTQQVIAVGIDMQAAETLAANHMGRPVPNTPAMGERSADRYRGGVFQVPEELEHIPGIYTPDLVIYLLGQAGLPLKMRENAEESIVAMKELLLVWSHA